MSSSQEDPKVPKKDLAEGEICGLGSSMHKRFGALPQTLGEEQKCTIFRVPNYTRQNNPQIFMPEVVSIGPYHRGQPHLSAMEEKKWLYLHQFLQKSEASADKCIADMKMLEARARKCYSETIVMSSDTFVEMMLLDGCFIIQYLETIFDKPSRVWDVGWSASGIGHDLMLIENQIPFFILQCVATLLGRQVKPSYWAYLLTYGEINQTEDPPPNINIYHLLHLCHYYIVPKSPTKPVIDPAYPISWYMSLPCATELDEAGIKIRKKESSCDFTNVTFKSGVLEIPFRQIGDNTLVILRNLIALEQCKSLKLVPRISIYLYFLHEMVNTTNDVMILQRQGIIDSMLFSKELAVFFNKSCKRVEIMPDHYLAELFFRVNKYCKSKKHRYRAKLMRDYFSNPWSIFSLGAAIFLLLLTFTQTFYMVYAYYRPSN